MTDPTYDVQRQWEDMDPKTAHINQQAARIEALEAQVKAAVAVLSRYEMWESDIIVNADWSDATPKLTQDQFDAMLDIQDSRNDALALIKGGE